MSAPSTAAATAVGCAATALRAMRLRGREPGQQVGAAQLLKEAAALREVGGRVSSSGAAAVGRHPPLELAGRRLRAPAALHCIRGIGRLALRGGRLGQEGHLLERHHRQLLERHHRQLCPRQRRQSAGGGCLAGGARDAAERCQATGAMSQAICSCRAVRKSGAACGVTPGRLPKHCAACREHCCNTTGECRSGRLPGGRK